VEREVGVAGTHKMIEISRAAGHSNSKQDLHQQRRMMSLVEHPVTLSSSTPHILRGRVHSSVLCYCSLAASPVDVGTRLNSRVACAPCCRNRIKQRVTCESRGQIYRTTMTFLLLPRYTGPAAIR
jgi:hypothetical protein